MKWQKATLLPIQPSSVKTRDNRIKTEIKLSLEMIINHWRNSSAYWLITKPSCNTEFFQNFVFKSSKFNPKFFYLE